MSGVHIRRSAFDIMSDMLTLTKKMVSSSDVDFIVSAISKRSKLIEEYERIPSADIPTQNRAELDAMRSEIVSLNEKLEKSLVSLREEAKREVENALSNQKVLNYANNAISSSGSYMDYRK